jgi:hypothetical protein
MYSPGLHRRGESLSRLDKNQDQSGRSANGARALRAAE